MDYPLYKKYHLPLQLVYNGMDFIQVHLHLQYQGFHFDYFQVNYFHFLD
jgi:hypothetical protein